ncbi:MAG: HEPN domain-containing protein [Candidatus Micrarchaeota archaeon]
MASEEIVNEWLKLGKEDLELSEHLIKEGWFYRAALSHLQQAVEKYTKAFLISKDWELRKIHDLEVLLDEAAKYEPKFKKYVELGRSLTAFYTESRYPPLNEDQPSKKEAEKLLSATKQFVKEIEKII